MVDGIAHQMARLDGVMVDRARRATAGTAAAFRALASEVGPLLDRLFPDAAELRKYREDLALIARAEAAGTAGGGLSPDQAREARRRLRFEASGLDLNAAPTAIGSNDIVQVDQEALNRDLERLVGEIDTGLFDPLESKTLEAVQNFAEMSRGILDSLRGMVSSFKNGDIVGGILGILDMVGQVANLVAGITGKSNAFQGVGQLPQGSGNYGGGRALGGPVVAGKSYRVGERGPEWFTPGANGHVTPDGGGGGGNVYHISGNLLTEEFWSQIQQMDEQAAMKGALGGANMVQTMSQKRGRQRLGRGR
jgi:hypothetical protein